MNFLMILLMSLSSSATAQTVLEESLKKAQSDLIQVESMLQAEIDSNNPAYDACRRRDLLVQKSYDQWFVNHYLEIKSYHQELERLLGLVNGKLSTLRSQRVEVLPTKADQSEATVSFAEMIKYFKMVNSRFESCKPSSKKALREDLEIPASNSLGLAHSQVVTAMNLLAQTLNASLRESNESFGFEFISKEDRFYFNFIIQGSLNQSKVEMKIDLLSSFFKNDFILDEKKQWQVIINSGLKIDEKSLNPLHRYNEFVKDLAGSCQLSSMQVFLPMAPYVSFLDSKKNHDDLLKDLAKSERLKNGIDEISHFNFIKIKPGVELQSTELTQLAWFEITGELPLLWKNSLKECPNSYQEVSPGKGICADFPVDELYSHDIPRVLFAINQKDPFYHYRIPTEDEWRSAAGDLNQYSLKSYWSSSNSGKSTHAVEQTLPNSKGFFDLFGNAIEFVGNLSELKLVGGSALLKSSDFSKTFNSQELISRDLFYGVGLRLVRKMKNNFSEVKMKALALDLPIQLKVKKESPLPQRAEVSSALGTTSLTPTSTNKVVLLQNDVELKTILSSSKNVPVILDFYADWCGPCQSLSPKLDRLMSEFGNKIIIVKINIDHHRSLSDLLKRTNSIPEMQVILNGDLQARVPMIAASNYEGLLYEIKRITGLIP